MKVLYFDCFSGISGDMTIGALLDLGIDIGMFMDELSKLKLDGYEIKVCKKIKNGITGTDVSVILEESEEAETEACKEVHGEAHVHVHHDHSHMHRQGHQHDKKHEHSQDARNYRDICTLIEESGLRPAVKSFSKSVFLEIAQAEAKVHNKGIDEVHFHEVGAVDSIVDIVGTAICLELLAIDKIYSSELHDGYGTIVCRHGEIPVPVPAVMEMLADSGIPLISENVPTELVTPTGMALIKKMACSFGRMPAMLVEKSGYGMGKRETGKFNALRAVMGTINEKNDFGDEISVLETNIDDTTSEILGYTSEKLLQAGALDVFFTPIYMKKNRPAFLLTILANQLDEDSLVDIVLKQTSTIGVRKSTCKRFCMKREIVAIQTQFGEVRLKIASWGGFIKASPEYEDCRRIAEGAGIQLKKVYEILSRIADDYLKNSEK